MKTKKKTYKMNMKRLLGAAEAVFRGAERGIPVLMRMSEHRPIDARDTADIMAWAFTAEYLFKNLMDVLNGLPRKES